MARVTNAPHIVFQRLCFFLSVCLCVHTSRFVFDTCFKLQLVDYIKQLKRKDVELVCRLT